MKGIHACTGPSSGDLKVMLRDPVVIEVMLQVCVTQISKAMAI